jgi:hypothetical protein
MAYLMLKTRGGDNIFTVDENLQLNLVFHNRFDNRNMYITAQQSDACYGF